MSAEKVTGMIKERSEILPCCVGCLSLSLMGSHDCFKDCPKIMEIAYQRELSQTAGKKSALGRAAS